MSPHLVVWLNFDRHCGQVVYEPIQVQVLPVRIRERSGVNFGTPFLTYKSPNIGAEADNAWATVPHSPQARLEGSSALSVQMEHWCARNQHRGQCLVCPPRPRIRFRGERVAQKLRLVAIEHNERVHGQPSVVLVRGVF